ncbi:MAG: hypothetical protein U9N44_05080 [Chloroflexota bacterium]|nr:hypothetical protein [Chloroflexota bacterium]
MSGIRSKKNFKRPESLTYWIAVASYVVIVSVSILWLVAYVPDLSGRVYIFTLAVLIVFLVFGTAFFVWETVQWRKKRTEEGQRNIEEIIDEMRPVDSANAAGGNREDK